MNDLGTAKICVSACGNGKEYAFDQSAYTSMTDTGLDEGINYPISASSCFSTIPHTRITIWYNWFSCLRANKI